MTRPLRFHVPRLAVLLALTAGLGLAGCAPAYTNSTYSGADIGRSATVSFGVIVSMRAVVVQGGGTGVGTVAGAVAGGIGGSFIGGGGRANALGALGGALIGGIAGTVIENGANQRQAVEFIIQEDSGQTISVVQSNEENFRPGDRVVLTRGARTRLGRVNS